MEYSESQKKAIEYIKEGKNIFLTGSAGNGKSYLLKSLKTLFPDKCIVLTATTGVAAFNLTGCTINSLLGLGIGEYSIEKIIKKMFPEKRKFIKNIDILVIDEISMMNSVLLEQINNLLKQITMRNIFMGGIQIIVSGDFFQLPTIKGNLVFENKLWKNFIPIILDTNFRQTGDTQYFELLQRIRIGNVKKEDIELLKTRIKRKKETFSIFPINSQVNSFNEKMYNELKTEEHTFTTKYRGDNSLIKELKKQFLDKNLEVMKLKVGCRVMLVRNLNSDIGLVNGSMGIVKEIGKQCVNVIFDHIKNKPVEIVELEWKNELGRISCVATQIPLIVAFSSNIHKLQGSTLNEANMDLSKCFCFHQVYVALSRIKTLDGLYLTGFDAKKIMVNKKVVEYYKEIE